MLYELNQARLEMRSVMKRCALCNGVTARAYGTEQRVVLADGRATSWHDELDIELICGVLSALIGRGVLRSDLMELRRRYLGHQLHEAEIEAATMVGVTVPELRALERLRRGYDLPRQHRRALRSKLLVEKQDGRWVVTDLGVSAIYTLLARRAKASQR